MFVLLVYLISALSWGTILFQLSKVIVSANKAGLNTPPLLIPLVVASLALFIESMYFGFSAYIYFAGNKELFFMTIKEENWFLIKLLIAISGVLMLFHINFQKNLK